MGKERGRERETSSVRKEGGAAVPSCKVQYSPTQETSGDLALPRLQQQHVRYILTLFIENVAAKWYLVTLCRRVSQHSLPILGVRNVERRRSQLGLQ